MIMNLPKITYEVVTILDESFFWHLIQSIPWPMRSAIDPIMYAKYGIPIIVNIIQNIFPSFVVGVIVP